MASIIYISLQMWCSWSMMQSPLCLRSSPGISSVPGAFPAFRFLTAATISKRRMVGSLQWLGPKVGALRQEESMVGWWLYSAFAYSNHLFLISSGLERSSPLLLRMEFDAGLLSIPLAIVLIVLKTSLLLFCCMFVSSIWHFQLNNFSLSAFRPLWIDLVRWLYPWRKLGSWWMQIIKLFSFPLSALYMK